MQSFDEKIDEVCRHMTAGIDELHAEMDGAMFQFMVEGKDAVGKKKTQRVL